MQEETGGECATTVGATVGVGLGCRPHQIGSTARPQGHVPTQCQDRAAQRYQGPHVRHPGAQVHTISNSPSKKTLLF